MINSRTIYFNQCDWCGWEYHYGEGTQEEAIKITSQLIETLGWSMIEDFLLCDDCSKRDDVKKRVSRSLSYQAIKKGNE
jgi:rubredoxin